MSLSSDAWMHRSRSRGWDLVAALLIVDAGDHPGFISTLRADRDIGVKHAFQMLRAAAPRV
jgi:hypothetical protein